MISGFCTAINPIDFTIWTSIVFSFGVTIGILMSSFYSFLTSCLSSTNVANRLCCIGEIDISVKVAHWLDTGRLLKNFVKNSIVAKSGIKTKLKTGV